MELFADLRINPMDFVDESSFLFFLILLALAVPFMIFVGVPVLIFLFDSLLIIPVILVVGVLSRVLFRRPWTIEATRTDVSSGPPVVWNVVGWRASSRAAGRMETLIYATGGVPPDPPADIVRPHAHRRLVR